ncbi:hypothetical protein JCM3774_000434 [Rhodotorula dairenensis]
MPPKRGRDPLDDPKSGPSKHQLRGLAYVGKQPAFLRNAAAALAGHTASSANRAPIPTRPEGYGGDDDEDGDASDPDVWDLDRQGDEAPQVVVLKEGKHIAKDEVDRIRAEAKASNSQDPLHATDTAPVAKGKGSLSFSTGTSAKTKTGGVGGHGDWADVVRSSRDEDGGVKRTAAKAPPSAAGNGSNSTPVPAAEDKAKAEKKKSKEKKKAKKQIGLLSFDDE